MPRAADLEFLAVGVGQVQVALEDRGDTLVELSVASDALTDVERGMRGVNKIGLVVLEFLVPRLFPTAVGGEERAGEINSGRRTAQRSSLEIYKCQ